MTLVDKSLFRPAPTFRGARKRVLVRVQVEHAAPAPLDALVRDISAQGMSAVARGAAPAPNEVVSVTLPDASSLWGIVRWAEGSAFGVEFDPGSRQHTQNGPAGTALSTVPTGPKET